MADSRRRRWRDETIDTRVSLVCDDLDEIEMNVTAEVAKIKRQQWAVILLLISTLLTIIGALLAVKG